MEALVQSLTMKRLLNTAKFHRHLWRASCELGTVTDTSFPEGGGYIMERTQYLNRG